MKKKKYIIGISIIIALIALVLIGRAMPQKQKTSRPDTFDTGTQGYKAFYLLMEKLNYNVERSLKPIESLSLSSPVAFIILEPYSENILKNHSTKLIDLANNGNTVFIAASQGSTILNALNVKYEFKPAVLKTEIITQSGESAGTAYGAGGGRIAVDERYFETLLQDETGIICASVKYEQGEIVVFSVPEIFNNINIDKEENVLLITSLIKSFNKDRIIFDESLHGYLETDSNFQFPPEMFPVFIQLGILLIFFYLVHMKRFGKPRVLKEEMERTAMEYVESISELFRRAGTHSFAVDNNIRGFKRRIARVCRISPESSNDRFIEAVKHIEGIDEGIITGILEKSKEISKLQKVTPNMLINLCREMDKVVQKLTKK